MAARFEDILHLAAYNGYAEDIRQAAAVNQLTWTDDRIWYPYLIAQLFGSKQKGRLQILAEHKNQFGTDEKLMGRFNALEDMASSSHHMKVFLAQIDVRDTEGESALTAAIKTRCPNAVEFLVNRGADINQTNKKGRSALNLAKSMDTDKDEEIHVIKKRNGRTVIAGVRQKRSEKITKYLTNLGAVDIPEEVDRIHVHIHNNMNNLNGFNARLIRFWAHPIPILNYPLFPGHVAGLNRSIALRTHDMNPPKPKRLKTSLYKRQFGR
jgi:ankyrin repeat protein